MKTQTKPFSLNFISFALGVALSAVALGVIFFVFSPSTQHEHQAAQEHSTTDSQKAAAPDERKDSSTNMQLTRDVRNLLDLHQHESEFQWTLALYTLVAHAENDQLFEFALQSKELKPDGRRDKAQRAIFLRLASISPRLAFEHAAGFPSPQKRFITNAIFEEWSKTDLEQAVSSASGLEGENRLAAVRGILQSRVDLPEEIRDKLKGLLNLQYSSINSLALESLFDLGENPETAWNALLTDEFSDDLQTGLLIQIAQSWFIQDGFSALQKINDSLRYASEFQGDQHNSLAILDSVVSLLAQQEPKVAFIHAVSLDNDEGDYIAKEITKTWAESDPQSAFEAVVNLHGNSSQFALESIVAPIWAQKEPVSLLNRLDSVSVHARTRAKEIAISTIAKESPQAAAEMIVNLEDSSSKRDIAWSIAMNWSSQDPHAALDWVLNSSHLQPMKNQLLDVVMRELVPRDPQLALNTALEQPISGNEIGMEATVVAQLANESWNAAISMLPRVREGRTKLAACGAIGQVLVGEGEFHQAFQLAENLRVASRKNYHQSIVESWAAYDPMDLVDSLDELPSSEAKSFAASLLLNPDPSPNWLTEEQIQHVKSFLLEQE